MSEQASPSIELCFFCNAEPGGKYGIGERCQTERFKIYEVKPATSDGTQINFSLSHVHREVIRFLGEHDGESFYEWSLINRTDDESLRDDYRRYGEPFIDHVKRLIKMGFVTERIIIGQTRVLLRLTEWGFKVYEQIKNQLNIIGLNTLPPKG